MAISLVHENIVFQDQVVYLAGNSYFDCTFRRCTLVFRDNIGPLTGCTFESCVWHIDLIVSDYVFWDEFVKGLAPMIGKSLPRPPGKTQH